MRRPTCRNRVLELPKIDVTLFDALEERDRIQLRAARRVGTTHVIASGSAVTANGKRIGHVSL